MFKELLTPEAFDFFARYLLAGYIVIIVRARFVYGLRAATSEQVVEAIVFSLINQLLFLLVTFALPASALNFLGDRGTLFVEVLILPALLGALLGWNLSRGWNNAVLRRLSLPVSRPTSRAYDFAFSRPSKPTLVILTFGDGSVIYGLFGESSFASNNPDNSDLYLERLYTVDDEGVWHETAPTRGALISLSGLRSIEFLDELEDDNG